MESLQQELKAILHAHWCFYRKHPWLMLLFILGLSLGSGLLTAITGLNKEAKSRYQTSSALIDNPISHLIKPLTGKEYVDGGIWLQLRQAGITSAQPVLRGRLMTQEGKSVAIQGVNTLLWLKNYKQSQPLGPETENPQHSFIDTVFIDQQFTNRLIDKSGTPILLKLSDDQLQPKISFSPDIGLWGLTDLALADDLLDAKGQLSFIELSDVTAKQRQTIEAIIQGHAILVDTEQQDFDVLSEAFFFNLMALALLGYVVAAFLSFNAVKLTLTARTKLLHQMHLLGCRRTSINAAIAIELMFLSLLTAALGSSVGFVIANGLVLDINRTLVGLFQLDKALSIDWQWSNFFIGFALNVTALIVILSSQNNLARFDWQKGFYVLLITAAISLFGLLLFANTEIEALLLCFAILVLFILTVPKVLHYIISLPWPVNKPLKQWALADSKHHLNELQIAILAILIALGTSIGMQIMVKSFNQSLNAHLEKQLSADIYLRTDSLDDKLRRELQAHKATDIISIYKHSDGYVEALPATLASFGDQVENYQHIRLTSGESASLSHFANSGCLANEQSLIKFGLNLNQTIRFTQNDTEFVCRITGFFYDYGNPQISLLTTEKRHSISPLMWNNYGYSITLKQHTSVAHFSEVLINDFNQDSTKIMANKVFKKFANQLFQDTFMVTKALNGFILAIAILSLCTSLLSLSSNQLKQLAILRQLGVTQTQLLSMKLLQTTSLVAFTTICSVPLGIALGFALLKFVMPIAFGWTIHFYLDVPSLLSTCLLLIVVSAICAYLPIRSFTRFSHAG